MRKKKYSQKWAITYKDKSYIYVYGKKKAYELLYRLSQHVIGLRVKNVYPRKSSPSDREMKLREYNKMWRAKNPDKLKAYREKYRKLRANRTNGEENGGAVRRRRTDA